MPKSCSARGCSNHHMMKEKKVSFFRLPNLLKRPERRSLWVSACQRVNPDGTQWMPVSKYVYICSEHFVSGRPVDEPSHVDYVPTVFNTSQQIPLTSSSRSKKPRKSNSHMSAEQHHQKKKMDAVYEAAEALISLAKTHNVLTSMESASNTNPSNPIGTFSSNPSEPPKVG